MRVKTFQDRCVAKEGVVSRVRKHNVNLLNEQGQYKDVVRTLNNELKETRAKLEEVDHQKETLQKELTTLREQVEKAGAAAITEFKASQSFIDSCANYYGTGFDDCLRQVASAFLELDLFRITTDESGLSTPAGDTPAHGGDDPRNDDVVLAQLATNPPVPSSNLSIEFLDVENPPAQDGGDGNPTDAPAS